MDFTHAVTIVITGEFASSMVHTLMAVSPALQTRINAVLIRLHQCTGHDGVFDEGLDGLLLHIGQQLAHDLTTALYHPKNGWPLFLQGPAASFAFEPTSTSLSALALHHLVWSNNINAPILNRLQVIHGSPLALHSPLL